MEYLAKYNPDPSQQSYGILDLQLLYKVLLSQHIDTQHLLLGSGIQIEQLSSSKTAVSFNQKLHVYRNALQLSGQPHLGLEVGINSRVSDFGMLGYAFFSSANLGDALLLGFKYLRLAGPVLRKRMGVENGICYFQGEGLLELDEMLPFCTEYWFSAIYSLCCEVLGAPIHSIKLSLPYPKPTYATRYADIFNCEIEFDSPMMEWQFDASILAMDIPSANAATLSTCIQSCEQIQSKLRGAHKTSERIAALLLSRPGQYPSIEQTALEFGMSSRTLRRHLDKENSSYSAIVADTRFAVASQYLEQHQLSLDEIASRVGFSDVSNFRNAFKKWAGLSPSQYRKSMADQHLA
ncbi:AraC family transcriptional regulator [Alginatibacterium sediminis]|uniref:AraC family transcriptional regulator n=1 Tax=Alginatibacterium sediminis TaxID=2164068 RepID=A0A420EBG9_9ALTE|nr:AraC family transcriptional regulator [Alginatibacterium sediminis]RKF18021.1 AraC family transcriptional regulator [Alginatibacterium sediminis]